MPMEQEAWLAGEVEGVPAVLMPAVHALMQAARDIEKAVKDLTVEELWTKPGGAPSVGFHLQHIAGSLDRLLTYSRGEKLTDEQFVFLQAETEIEAGADLAAIKQKAIKSIEKAIAEIRATPVEILFEKRTVGRQKLPTNVFGLFFHIAEHTQRHVGQVITTAKIVNHFRVL